MRGIWWLLEAVAWLGWMDPWPAEWLRWPLLWAGAALAVGVACYTAFLFGQAEGRDLWQSPLLPVHLVVQAVMAGAARCWWPACLCHSRRSGRRCCA